MYKDEFGIGEQSGVINYLNAHNTSKISEEFVKHVVKTPLKTVEEIGNVFTNVISNISQNNNSSVSSSGGIKGSVSSYNISSSLISSNTEKLPIGDDNNTPSVFKDVPTSHWAYECINELYRKNIIVGKGEGIFEPDASIKREEFIKMLITAANIDSVNFVNVFLDVDKDSWYNEFVNIAAIHKIAMGKPDGTFGVGEEISRQDACVFLYRAAKVTRQKFVNYEISELSFEDSDNISEYAKESIQKLFTAGVVSGTEDNNFSPLRSITRAEAAKILYNVFTEVN